MPQKALKYDTEVKERGRVFVIENPNDIFDDLVSASQSSLGFWDNQFDNEERNNYESNYRNRR